MPAVEAPDDAPQPDRLRPGGRLCVIRPDARAAHHTGGGGAGCLRAPSRAASPDRPAARRKQPAPPAHLRLTQRTACFTSAVIFFSSAGVRPTSANAVGHITPLSRFADSLKPSVA